MNTVVEVINSAGRAFVDFSLPMLIQSGVLVLILLAVDMILRRKVRAVLRYWIWMLVLVKLVLPPSLGSPMSVGTWFGDELEVPAASLLEPRSPGPAELSPAISTILSPPDPLIAQPPVPPAPVVQPAVKSPAMAEAAPAAHPPASSLNWQGLTLLVWLAVVTALSLLLVQRAFFVRGLVVQTGEASSSMLSELQACCGHLGLRRRIGLRLSPNATSPAVCGLLRPVILIPHTLAPRLHGHDLHAVLLHELAHIKRGDLWVNLAQTLLQIVYFYNPLLWLANAMIRRTREQAVDETVLVALGETAQQYPETLVNVAKIAFTRPPTLSLRLIGVVESKSALTARIQHILNRPLPKTAKLGLLGLLLIVVVAGVLLPMAGAAENKATVEASGPLDIRLVGVCPDGGEELYDADGKKLNATLGPTGLRDRVWDADQQRRDFVFQLPALQGQLLFLPFLPLCPAGTDYRLGGSGDMLDAEEIPSRLIVSRTFQRAYRRPRARLFRHEVPIRKIDLTLQYFYGPKREAVCTFTGPFATGQVVQADDGRPCRLTPMASGVVNESRIRFRFTTSQSVAHDVPALLYDKESRRHVIHHGSGSIGSRGADLVYEMAAETIPWDQIAAIAVGEKPYEVTFRNIVVEYRGRPLRTYPPHWDQIAARLGLTGAAAQRLDRYEFRDAREAIGVLDLIRSPHHMETVRRAMGQSRARGDLAAFDGPARDKIRQTAAKWLQSSSVSARATGVELGLTGGLPEFVDPAFALLEYRHPTDVQWTNELHNRVLTGFQWYMDQMTAEDVQRLKHLALQCDDGRFWSRLAQCCFNTSRNPAVADALWELAQDDRPWLWWPSLAKLLERDDPRVKQHQNLPEPMRVRLALVVRGQMPGEEALRPSIRATLPGLFTVDAVRMYPQMWWNLRAALTTYLDRRETTAVYMDFLRAASQPSAYGRFDVEHGSHNALYEMASALLRDINLWYGVNLGQLGLAQPGRFDQGLQGSAELVQATTEAWQWYQADPQRPAVEPLFEGRVVDSAGKPVAGATVTLHKQVILSTSLLGGTVHEAGADTTQTDAAGRFTFRDLPPARSHRFQLSVEAEGFADHANIQVDQLPDGRFYFQAAPEEDAVIVLEKPATLGGSVIGSDGKPLALAELSLSLHPTHGVSNSQHIHTDAQGRFVYGPIMSGSHLLRYGQSMRQGDQGGYPGLTAARLVRLEEGQTLDDVVLDLRESTACLEIEIVGGDGRPIAADRVSLNVGSVPDKPRRIWILSLEDVKPRRVHRIPNLPPLEGYLDVLVRSQPPRQVAIKLVPSETTRCRVEFDSVVGGTNSRAVQPVAGVEAPGRIILPEVDRQSVVLDLATGQVVPLPQAGPEPGRVQQALRELGKGDLLYDVDQGDRTLILLRDAASPQARDDTGEPGVMGYLVGEQLPQTLTITTAERRRYEVTIVAAAPDACMLKYSLIEADRGAGGGALVELGKTGYPLELRIVPRRDDLAPGVAEEYGKALVEGRTPPDSRYLWVPVRPGTNLPPFSITRERDGKLHLLVHNEEPFIMVPGQGWRIADVGRDTDQSGRPMVMLRFDDAGADRMFRLTGSNMDRPLALLVEGVVVSAPMISGRTGIRAAVITGNFTEQGVIDMIATLRQGRIEPSTRAGDTSEMKLLHVQGVVTDASGRPMAGVEVNVDCGFEKPQRADRAVTDENGRYTLNFKPAIYVADSDPCGVGIQPAFVWARKDGFYETSLRHKGNLAIAGKKPGPEERQFVAERAGVVLPHEPYELNFTMAPAARIEGTLVDAQDKPLAARMIALLSRRMYPANVGFELLRTDGNGRFTVENVPCTSFQFDCVSNPLGRSAEMDFTRAGTWRLNLKYRQTGQHMAELVVMALREPAADSATVVARLPNGVTVELLASSRLGSAGLEWQTPRGERTTVPGIYEADVEGHGSLLALRFEPEPARIVAWSYQPPDVRAELKKWRMNDGSTWLAALGQERSYVNVEILAEAKDPIMVQVVPVQQKDVNGEVLIGACASEKIMGFASIDSNSVQFAVSSAGGGPRVVAVLDTSGSIHPARLLPIVRGPKGVVRALGQRYHANVPLNDLAGVVIEGYTTRAGSAKFRNISLVAGQPTQVQVEAEPEQLGPIWYASGLDSQLSTLGVALSTYAEAHAGRYPADLSALRDYMARDDRESMGLHVTYLGKGKISTTAAGTILAYAKTLLSFGFGTYVLYPDRRVEFEVPGKLRELGITSSSSESSVETRSSSTLAWQRTDRYFSPEPNGFFPDDPEGGKKLDVLFSAGDRNGRPDAEILSTVRQGFRRTTRSHNSVLQWIGNRFIWGKQPQNPEAIEIMYHAVPLEQHIAVYSGLSVVKNKTPNVLRTLADICMQGEEVERVTWGIGDQREGLLAYVTPYLQDENPAKQEMAAALLKYFKGELDFQDWLRGYRLRQGQAKFGPQLAQLKETLLTGNSEARYQALTATVHDRERIESLDDSFLSALRVASDDPNPRVRKAVANAVGYRWVWSARQQDPNAIELMLKLSSDSEREVRYDAVYYGLSVVRDKSEAVVRRLVDLALADQDQDFYGRIVWGLGSSVQAKRSLMERILTEELEGAQIEAGRAAVRSLWLDVFREEPPAARDISGRVVDPEGNLVAGAQVALITAKASATISHGKLEPTRFGSDEKAQVIETDEQGRFRFESEPNDGFSLVVAHNAGFALVGSEALADDGMIRLGKWGRIEGQVAEGRRPLHDQIWMGGVPNETWLQHRRNYNYETRCDNDGRFKFEKVPAGWFEVGYLTRIGDSASSITSRTPVKVKPGETVNVRLGGEGRPVIGRFVPPAGYKGPIYFGEGLRSLDTSRPEMPGPANYDQMTKRQQQEWSQKWWQTPEAQAWSDAIWHDPNRRHYVFRINDDGSFRIEDVIAGTYDLTVYLEERLPRRNPPQEDLGGYHGDIEMPPIPGGRSDEPLDLGDLVLRMNEPPLKVGDTAPLFEAKTLDGKDIRLADFRGKYVLLSFWQPEFHPELSRLEKLQAAYGDTGKFQIVELGGGDTLAEVGSFVREHKIEWPEIYFGEKWDGGIAKQYRLSGLPYILLVDPEGKIVATWLRGEKLTETVKNALAQASEPSIAQPRPGISGQVLDPNGNTVAQAQVALCTPGNGVEILEGKLERTNLQVEPDMVMTDSQGRFAFSSVPAEYVLVAAHETGIAQVGTQGFVLSPVLRLEPWGRVEGTLYIGRRAAEDRIVMLMSFVGQGPAASIHVARTVGTTSGGRFVFAAVPPGWLQIGLRVEMDKHSSGWTGTRSIHVPPGRTLEVTIGGVGRPIVGKFVPPRGRDGPVNFAGGMRILESVGPAIPPSADGDKMNLSEQREWLQTPTGRAWREAVQHDRERRSYAFHIEEGGMFRIEDVVPGQYEFTVLLTEEQMRGNPEDYSARYRGTIEVPEMSRPYTDEPLDLGDLVLEMKPASSS